jgi:hypothetical protein
MIGAFMGVQRISVVHPFADSVPRIGNAVQIGAGERKSAPAWKFFPFRNPRRNAGADFRECRKSYKTRQNIKKLVV